MGRDTLADKLATRTEPNPEATWTLRRWPKGMTDGTNRLFVASGGKWCGYFVLSSEGLLNLDDPGASFTLLFDTRTWTRIEPVPVKPFRGFTYRVPSRPSELAESASGEGQP